MKKIRMILHDLEWWQSCDTSEAKYRKTSCWITEKPGVYKCYACGAYGLEWGGKILRSKYCPACGALMEINGGRRMTNDEACAILSGYQHIHRKDKEAQEAFQMAIYALEEMDEDKIKVGDEISSED